MLLKNQAIKWGNGREKLQHGFLRGPFNTERIYDQYWQPITVVGLNHITGKSDNYDGQAEVSGEAR